MFYNNRALPWSTWPARWPRSSLPAASTGANLGFSPNFVTSQPPFCSVLAQCCHFRRHVFGSFSVKFDSVSPGLIGTPMHTGAITYDSPLFCQLANWLNVRWFSIDFLLILNWVWQTAAQKRTLGWQIWSEKWWLFRLKNDEFLLKNVEFPLKNEDLWIKHRRPETSSLARAVRWKISCMYNRRLS